MWCEVQGTRGIYENRAKKYLAIIYHADHPETDVEETMILSIGHGIMTVDPKNVTPRPDLPRAWRPDGSPVKMGTEIGTVRDFPREGSIGASYTYLTNKPEGTTMRRFVGEWEEE